jgi:hypothetical protein
MASISVYRGNAENCLRLAQGSQDKAEKSLWITLAQSWLQLAELSARSSLAAGDDHLSYAEDAGGWPSRLSRS